MDVSVTFYVTIDLHNHTIILFCSKRWPAPSWPLCSVSSPAPVRPAALASAWSSTVTASDCSRFVPRCPTCPLRSPDVFTLLLFNSCIHLFFHPLLLGGRPPPDLHDDHGGAAGVQPPRKPQCPDVFCLPALLGFGQSRPQLELPASQLYPFFLRDQEVWCKAGKSTIKKLNF